MNATEYRSEILQELEAWRALNSARRYSISVRTILESAGIEADWWRIVLIDETDTRRVGESMHGMQSAYTAALRSTHQPSVPT